MLKLVQDCKFWGVVTLLCLVAIPTLCFASSAPSHQHKFDKHQYSTPPKKGDSRTAEVRSIFVGGVERTYLIQPVKKPGLYPVVIVLHGGGDTGKDAWTQTSLPMLGAKNGFIVVAPDGVDEHWNDGRGATISGDRPSTADDLGFLKALIAHVVAKDNGDPNSVFMAGASNGAFMTMHFVCESGQMLRAAASAIANLTQPRSATCSIGKPLPWLFMNGTRDPVVPFEAQPAGVNKKGDPLPAMLSSDESFDFFAANAGCGKAAEIHMLPDINRFDRSRAELRTRQGCSSVQYVFHNGGHFWPGMRSYKISDRGMGNINKDVDAGMALWGFFASTM